MLYHFVSADAVPGQEAEARAEIKGSKRKNTDGWKEDIQRNPS
jgi:hypothetical protein